MTITRGGRNRPAIAPGTSDWLGQDEEAHIDESLADLQRQLDQARQNLADAYARARAVRYLLGSDQMAALQDAERRYQNARSLWQDRHRPDADPTRPSRGDPGSEPDVVIDLRPDGRIDRGSPRRRAGGRRPTENGPGR